jgi:uncharacterized protein DUF4345
MNRQEAMDPAAGTRRWREGERDRRSKTIETSTRRNEKDSHVKTFSRFAPWINRLVLAGATFVFAMIGLRYVSDPVHAAAETGVSLGSALALTTTRVGSGAFPLGFAIFTFACLVSTRRLLTGVSLVAIVITTAIVVRLIGLAVDGPDPASNRLFIPEAIMLLLAATGIVLERARRRNDPKVTA